MQNFLNFSFLAILNLFVIILGAAPGYYSYSRGTTAPALAGRMNVLGVILLILTVIAVVADIVFMVKVLAG